VKKHVGCHKRIESGNTIGYPADIAVDSVGNVYISDISTEQIVEKLVNGDTYNSRPRYESPYHMAIDRQNTYLLATPITAAF